MAKKLNTGGEALLLQPYVRGLSSGTNCRPRHTPVAVDMVQCKELPVRFATTCTADSAIGIVRYGFVANVTQAQQRRFPRACSAARLEAAWAAAVPVVGAAGNELVASGAAAQHLWLRYVTHVPQRVLLARGHHSHMRADSVKPTRHVAVEAQHLESRRKPESGQLSIYRMAGVTDLSSMRFAAAANVIKG